MNKGSDFHPVQVCARRLVSEAMLPGRWKTPPSDELLREALEKATAHINSARRMLQDGWTVREVAGQLGSSAEEVAIWRDLPDDWEQRA